MSRPQPGRGKRRVSAVVPAHNEAGTIGGVIAALVGHPLIDEVIVVDDASTDDTAALARAAGAAVISMPQNGGKAAAMSLGVEAARNDIIFFSDADLSGLTEDAITRIVKPVLMRDYGMYVGIRGRRTYWVNRLLHFTPILGGERALIRALWNRVPQAYKRHFQIEIALNFFAKLYGYRMGLTVIPGLEQVIKERKRGLVRGLWQRFGMIADIMLVSWRIYVVLQAQLLFDRHPREPETAQRSDLAP
jgi:glycosyltransferase involved in cell wall biosynthesis